jgi:serine/threonine-protein kinase
MPPEQQEGSKRVTAASDLYSLGVIIYELFTGLRPMGRFRPPSELSCDVTPDLEQLIHRCLEPDPAARFSSADEIKDRVLGMLQGAHLPTAQRERARQALARIEDKFALLDVIKENRYGAVYLYQDRVDERLLILKKKVGTTVGLAEAKLLTTLKHKNIVDVVGASGTDRIFILVMEYLSGGSLRDRLIQPLAWGEGLRTAREVCEALAFAHKNRIFHGNLRPSNILFTETGRAKLADFGLNEHYPSGTGGGNWYNMFDEERSVAADIFAAGTIFYQMLTGGVPVWNERKLVPSDYFKMLPAALQEMITRMIACQPGTRPASFDQVIAEIDALLAAWEENPSLPGASEAIDLESTTQNETTQVTTIAPPKSHRGLVTALILVAVLLVGTAALAMHTDYLVPVREAVLALLEKVR